MATVNSVTVSPNAVTVNKGGSQSFSAEVAGTDSPAQTVTWSVDEPHHADTAFTGNTLNVAAGETAASLTVRATSTVDTSKSGAATVTVSSAMATVNSVTVSPATATVAKGGSQSFSAVVAGTGDPAQTVTWSVDEPHHADTAFTGNTLNVAAGETSASLTVRATSAVDAAKSGTASVTVAVAGEQDIPPLTYNPSEWGYGNVMDMTYSVNGTNIVNGTLNDTTEPKGNTPADSFHQTAVYQMWFDWLYNMKIQSENLKNGYAAVADVYPRFSALRDGENSITTAIGSTSNVGTYITNAKGHFDTILDSIFTEETRADFDKYYNAYTAGMYAQQKARSQEIALSAYTTVLNATGDAGLIAQGIGALPGLRERILSAINTALGTGDMTNTGNKTKAEELNGHFITQIADLYELEAIMNDLVSLDFSNDIVNPQTLVPSTIDEMYDDFYGD
jgi:hypothetical protein